MKPTHSAALPIALLTALVFAVFALAACHSTPASNLGADASGSVPFQTLRRGYQSGAHAEQCNVISDAESWAAWWKMHASLSLPAPELPPVDFEKNSVLVLSLGNRPSAGYGVEIVRVSEQKGMLAVEAVETPPAKDMLHPQIVTQPYHIVMLPHTKLKATLVVR